MDILNWNSKDIICTSTINIFTMKTQSFFKKVLFLGSLLLLCTLFSCDKIKDLTQKEIKQDFTASFNVSADEPGSFTDESTIFLLTSDLQEYEKNIDKVKIEEVQLEITSYSGGNDVVVAPAISSLNTTSKSATFEESSINLHEAFSNQTVIVYNSTADLNSVASAFKSEKKLTAKISGNVSNVSQSNPAQFTIKMTIKAVVTVKL